MKNIKRLLPLLLCCACSSGPQELGPRQFSQALLSDPDAVLIDVRRADEFSDLRIAGAAQLDVLFFLDMNHFKFLFSSSFYQFSFF